MSCASTLYHHYFKAEDRFLNRRITPGYEPDIIIDFVQSGLNLASLYCLNTPTFNPILRELFLRRVFFHLIEAINQPNLSRIFRRICLDHIHCPLLALKKFYGNSDTGRQQLLSLQQHLQQTHLTSGL
jgi:hypothetical protein